VKVGGADVVEASEKLENDIKSIQRNIEKHQRNESGLREQLAACDAKSTMTRPSVLQSREQSPSSYQAAFLPGKLLNSKPRSNFQSRGEKSVYDPSRR